MKTLSRFFCLALFFLAIAAAAPAGSKIRVGQIPIGPDNPRNSEGDFITLSNGDILYVYTRYTGGSSGDDDPAYLASRRSSDGGATWTSEEELVLPQEGKLNSMSVTLRRLPNGKIAIFYLVKESITDCRPYMRISDDETQTWGERIPMVATPSYNVMNNDRVAILESGRILAPVSRHALIDSGLSANGEAFCLISDDGGATWREGGRVPKTEGVIYQEPGVCELADGRVLMNIRTNAGTQFFTYSSDGGESWSEPAPSVLEAPVSPALIKRIPGSDDLLAVWNPLLGKKTEGAGSRALIHYGRLSPDGTQLLGRAFLVSTIGGANQNWQYPAILFLNENEFLTAFFSWSSGIDLYKVAVPKSKRLFNGTDLSGWTKFLRKRTPGEDPNNVFTVENGMLRISGEEYGGISTEEEFSNFHMSLEFKWGEETHAPREGRARDTGFLFHASGNDGDFGGVWLWAYEANIVEGGIGDFWLVGGEDEGYTATGKITEVNGKRLFDPEHGESVTITQHKQGPFRWWGFAPDWKDETGFRGPNEIAQPGEWTKFDVVAEDDWAEFYVNNILVNRITNFTRTSGRFQIQSEGAEVYYRNITVTQ